MHLSFYRWHFLILATALVAGGCRSKHSRAERETDRAEQPVKEPTNPGSIAGDSTDRPDPKVQNPEKWNFPGIAWTQREAALSHMKSSGRPGLVVLKGEWCPHCRKLAEVFFDPKVKQLTESFELILLDSDSPEAASYEQTGSYVPRTLFLRPDGSLDRSLLAPNPKFPHFFSSRDKASLQSAMEAAISRYGS